MKFFASLHIGLILVAISGCAKKQPVEPAGPPKAPSNLVISSSTETSITIQWSDNSGDETGFKIERKAVSGNPAVAAPSAADYSQITTPGQNITKYMDSGLTKGTTYYYRVAAYSSLGNSGFSNEVSATPGVPVSPSNLAVSVENNILIKITWTDNSTDETGFYVYRKIEGGTYSMLVSLPANTAEYSDNTVIKGRTYFYTLQSFNNVGKSPYSNEVSALARGADKIGLPTGDKLELTFAQKFEYTTNSKYLPENSSPKTDIDILGGVNFGVKLTHVANDNAKIRVFNVVKISAEFNYLLYDNWKKVFSTENLSDTQSYWIDNYPRVTPGCTGLSTFTGLVDAYFIHSGYLGLTTNISGDPYNLSYGDFPGFEAKLNDTVSDGKSENLVNISIYQAFKTYVVLEYPAGAESDYAIIGYTEWNVVVMWSKEGAFDIKKEIEATINPPKTITTDPAQINDSLKYINWCKSAIEVAPRCEHR